MSTQNPIFRKNILEKLRENQDILRQENQDNVLAAEPFTPHPPAKKTQLNKFYKQAENDKKMET